MSAQRARRGRRALRVQRARTGKHPRVWQEGARFERRARRAGRASAPHTARALPRPWRWRRRKSSSDSTWRDYSTVSAHESRHGVGTRPRRALIAARTRRLERARLFYGHGTDNARDEAAALVLPRHAAAARRARARVAARRPRRSARVEKLLEQRIAQRVPLAYLTHEAWFAGSAFLRRRTRADPALADRRTHRAALRALDRRAARASRARSSALARAASRWPARRRFHARASTPWTSTPARSKWRRSTGAPAPNTARAARGVRPFRGAFGASYDIIVSNPPYVGDARDARPAARVPARAATRARVRTRGTRFRRNHPASRRAPPAAARVCWWWRWATPSVRCDARIRECRSPGSNSNAAAAECSC